MPTVEVPRQEWPEFLEAFSRRHRAWLTTVEPPVGEVAASGAEPRPLAGVVPQHDGRGVSAIEIAFAGDSGADVVRVENPASLRVRTTDAGADRGLEIVDAHGGCTRVGFRTPAVPELLDGLAPGEL